MKYDIAEPPLLGVRSCFSLCAGVLTPERIAALARETGRAAVGVADRNNLYGLIRFLTAAAREGVTPITGALLETDGRPLCLALVLNAGGFGRLCELVSLIQSHETRARYFSGSRAEAAPPLEAWEAKPGRPVREQVLANLLAHGWEGLALASTDPDFLLALRHRDRRDLFVKLSYGEPFAKRIRWAVAHDFSCLAAAESVAENAADAELFHLLRAIDLRVTVDALPAAQRLSPAAFIPPPGRLAAFFNAVPEALRNADAVAERAAAADIITPRPIFPRFEGLAPSDEYALLAARCRQGIRRRYGRATPPVTARLAYELSIIRDKGFAGYFLVVEDIVRRCPRTCGRGSAAASIVSYLLGITHVDPLRYNLFFERFLNRGRNDPPDIDVDFPWDERADTLAYVFAKYAGRAGMVADHVTFGPRSSLREAATAWGANEEETARLVRAGLAGDESRIPHTIRRAAARLKGLPRHIGMHPGGVVITPGPIAAVTHLQRSPLGWPVIAWEKNGAEEAGLVKIDLLGNRSLAVLRDVLTEVNTRYRAGLDWERFDPLADRDTERLIASGDTIGIFYIESPATRQLLTKMGTAAYEELVIASSIIRPAANRYIQEFVDRLHGKPYAPLHPALAETLAETFGIMVYQEDVSRVAIALAGFSPADADRLRKVLSKKAGREGLRLFQERFSSGARRAGMTEAAVQAVWEMILSFDGYSFCKAHSASYAQVSYRLAWLKRRYPLEFMAAVINNGGGFYTRQTYLDEVRRMG
ncbi:MAG TPA: DNA polymerase III subunit alpha, partial [Spirochaetia bacterium]|nr:DNA polymerase III subunit alpha [Spirochaetia bacterium]